MILWVLRQLLYLRNTFKTQDTARQMAWGLALGMLVGVVPKGNLLAPLLAMSIVATRVNLATAMLGAVGFSLLGSVFDPVSHRIGISLLTADSLRGIWIWLYHLPVVPWTNFNNTVVLGSLLGGLMGAYPCYRLSLPWFEQWRTYLDRKQEKQEAPSESNGKAAPAPSRTPRPQITTPSPEPMVAVVSQPPSESERFCEQPETPAVTEPDQPLLDDPSEQQPQRLETAPTQRPHQPLVVPCFDILSPRTAEDSDRRRTA